MEGAELPLPKDWVVDNDPQKDKGKGKDKEKEKDNGDMKKRDLLRGSVKADFLELLRKQCCFLPLGSR